MSLYQEVILDHYRNPRNQGNIKNATHSAHASNISCGDKLHIDIIVKNDIIEDVRFLGSGCAISQASASLLTETIKKMPIEKVRALQSKDILELLNIQLSPTRLKCGLLSLETVKKALDTQREKKEKM